MVFNKSHSYFFDISDKKGVDTRLQGAQNTLLLQEDNIRRAERERKTMLDQISGLERQILAMENEKKQFLVSFLQTMFFREQSSSGSFLGKNGSIKIK